MTPGADFLIVGGGVAGLSAASRLARHGKVIVIEAEGALGYHSSGRSVSFSHFGIGNSVVRGLTAWSQAFYRTPPEGFCETPLARTAPSMWVAWKEMVPALDGLEADMRRFTDTVERVGPEEMLKLCPVVRTGPGAAVTALVDPATLKLDTDALLQSYARSVRAAGGEILTGRPIAAIQERSGVWTVTAESGEQWSAPMLINAAGAWADRIAALAGVDPLGVAPKRRTIIALDPPPGLEVSAWPFLHIATADFYMLPEAGRLLVSPADEVEDDPCDAQPEEYDIALAAYRLEQYTTLSVSRIAHRWAGLRSFVADRTPTAGFDPRASGFFWLVGQGGYGIQTAPAMAAIVEALATVGEWPKGLEAVGVAPEHIRPERLLSSKTAAT